MQIATPNEHILSTSSSSHEDVTSFSPGRSYTTREERVSGCSRVSWSGGTKASHSLSGLLRSHSLAQQWGSTSLPPRPAPIIPFSFSTLPSSPKLYLLVWFIGEVGNIFSAILAPWNRCSEKELSGKFKVGRGWSIASVRSRWCCQEWGLGNFCRK